MIETTLPLAPECRATLPAPDPAPLLEQLAMLRLENAELRAQNTALPARIRELEARLVQNLSDSSRPRTPPHPNGVGERLRRTERRATMFRRIVVPLDGSPLAEAILPAVQRLAADSPLEVVLLAVGRMPQGVEQRGATVAHVDEVVREQESDLRESLNQPAGRLRSAQIVVQTRVRFGDPAAEIVRCAEAEHADAIAMSTHGRTGLDRVLHGSVAGTVLRSTTLPLLLVRPAAEAFAALPPGATADG